MGVSSVFSVLISLTQIRSSHPVYDPLRFSQLGLSRPKLKKRGHASPSELLCLWRDDRLSEGKCDTKLQPVPERASLTGDCTPIRALTFSNTYTGMHKPILAQPHLNTVQSQRSERRRDNALSLPKKHHPPRQHQRIYGGNILIIYLMITYLSIWINERNHLTR